MLRVVVFGVRRRADIGWCGIWVGRFVGVLLGQLRWPTWPKGRGWMMRACWIAWLIGSSECNSLKKWSDWLSNDDGMLERDEGWSGCVHKMVQRRGYLASKKKGFRFEYGISRQEERMSRTKWVTKNVRGSKEFVKKKLDARKVWRIRKQRAFR